MMTELLDKELSQKIKKSRKIKNIIVASIIAAFVILVYLITIVKLGSN